MDAARRAEPSAPYRVLVVEDEAPLRRIITLNLARRGYTVAEAEDVAEACEALAAAPRPFDVILLDINLPDGSGWDVLRALPESDGAASDDHPRVIVITAVRPTQRRMEEFHPAAVLLKPFPIEALLRLVSRVLPPSAPPDEPAASSSAWLAAHQGADAE